MSTLRISSAEHPLDDPVVLSLLTRVLAKLEAMGLLTRPEQLVRLDQASVRSALGKAASSGIATRHLARLRLASIPDAESWIEVLRGVDRAIEESPVPTSEWPALTEILGPDLVAALLSISPSSIRRYSNGERDTPDEVADRLHFLALLVGDLAGAYNEIGIRRWFERPRSALDGRSPRQILERGWLPSDEGPRRIRELARSLSGSGAT